MRPATIFSAISAGLPDWIAISIWISFSFSTTSAGTFSGLTNCGLAAATCIATSFASSSSPPVRIEITPIRPPCTYAPSVSPSTLITRRGEMFSPILATSASRTSLTLEPLRSASLSASISLMLFAAATSRSSLPNLRKPSSRATKSVSQLSSSMVARPPSTLVRITPSAAIRPAFLAAFA